MIGKPRSHSTFVPSTQVLRSAVVAALTVGTKANSVTAGLVQYVGSSYEALKSDAVGASKLVGAVLIGSVLIALITTAPLWGGIINFDDINASSSDVPLDGLGSYQGLNWTNFSASTSVPGFPGYNNGIVSSQNAAYTAGDAFGSPIVSSIARTNGFDFTSAWLGSGWYDGLNVTLNGLSNGSQEFTQTVTVNTEAPQLFTFDFMDITELDLGNMCRDPDRCKRLNAQQSGAKAQLRPGGSVSRTR